MSNTLVKTTDAENGARSQPWVLYVLRCKDGSLYAGITVDLSRRLREHNEDDRLAAKYTRTRRPVELVFSENHPSRSAATRAEYQFKQLTRKQKLSWLNINK